MSMRKSHTRHGKEGITSTIARGVVSYRENERNHRSTARWRAAIMLLVAVALGGLLCSPLPNVDSKTSSEETNTYIRKHSSDKSDPCTIYFAPSSVKGIDGYGMFITRDVEAGSPMLTGGQDGPSIPVVDYIKGRWIKTWNEYWWERGNPDHVLYETENLVMDFQIGFGSMPNHNCWLRSLKHKYPDPAYDDSLVQRPSDPGTGAFSYSMGRQFIAVRDLQAGEELFINYGYCRRGEGESHGWPAFIPMEEDYEAAALICWAFLQVPSHVDVDIKAPEGSDDRVVQLLPKTTSELRDIVGSNKIGRPEDLIPLLAFYVGTTPRTPDWIRSHGMCLERLVARKSKLPHAGQGGFAQHAIRKGDIVVPAPLIHILDRDVLGGINGTETQLLMNYCFGHSQSSLLLCPETNALLINHCSDRQKECGPKGPNVSYRWSTGWEPKSDEWRKLTIEEIAKQTGRGLSMEIVALCDIEPGEEVYMDYGEEWEEAWAKHVATWKPPAGLNGDSVVTAKEANEQSEPLQLLVTGDLRNVSDHPYLFTGCQYWVTSMDKDEVWHEKNPKWMEMKDEDILHMYADDGLVFYGNYASHRDRFHWPCTVIRQEEKGRYTVRIHQAHWFPPKKWHRNDLPRILTNYPRSSIHYFVKPYAGDQHLPGVFRHPIGIRDEIFPEQWKNRK